MTEYHYICKKCGGNYSTKNKRQMYCWSCCRIVGNKCYGGNPKPQPKQQAKWDKAKRWIEWEESKNIQRN